jgi:hypothetical protein
MKSIAEIELEISEAFADVERPRRSLIAPHDCLECDEIRRDFDGQSWRTLDENVLRRHASSALSLFSAEAKRYFLPAWLIRAISDPESVYAETLTFAADSDHRWEPTEPYTRAQWEVIKSALCYIERCVHEFERPEVVSAIARIAMRPN